MHRISIAHVRNDVFYELRSPPITRPRAQTPQIRHYALRTLGSGSTSLLSMEEEEGVEKKDEEEEDAREGRRRRRLALVLVDRVDGIGDVACAVRRR